LLLLLPLLLVAPNGRSSESTGLLASAESPPRFRECGQDIPKIAPTPAGADDDRKRARIA